MFLSTSAELVRKNLTRQYAEHDAVSASSETHSALIVSASHVTSSS